MLACIFTLSFSLGIKFLLFIYFKLFLLHFFSSLHFNRKIIISWITLSFTSRLLSYTLRLLLNLCQLLYLICFSFLFHGITEPFNLMQPFIYLFTTVMLVSAIPFIFHNS